MQSKSKEIKVIKWLVVSCITLPILFFGYIERLAMLTNVSMAEKKDAARKMYKVYFNLQDFEG